MHPAVRLLTVLALASAFPAMSLAALALFGLAGLLLYRRVAAGALVRLRAGLWRLRWLLLAILVLYGGFTPGDPLLPILPGLSREGLAEGARRLLVLIDLMLVVYLMLALTPVAQLVAGIRLLAVPLRVFGVEPQRVGLRFALTLDAVGEMQARLKGHAGARGNVWDRAAGLIEDIEQRAGAAGNTVILAEAEMPRWWEWVLPLLLLAGLQLWTP